MTDQPQPCRRRPIWGLVGADHPPFPWGLPGRPATPVTVEHMGALIGEPVETVIEAYVPGVCPHCRKHIGRGVKTHAKRCKG